MTAEQKARLNELQAKHAKAHGMTRNDRLALATLQRLYDEYQKHRLDK